MRRDFETLGSRCLAYACTTLLSPPVPIHVHVACYFHDVEHSRGRAIGAIRTEDKVASVHVSGLHRE